MQINISIYIRRPSHEQIEALARLRRNHGTIARGYEARWENSQARQQRSIRAEIVKCPFVSKGLPESPLSWALHQTDAIYQQIPQYVQFSFNLRKFVIIGEVASTTIFIDCTCTNARFLRNQLSLYGKGQTVYICLDSKQHVKHTVTEYLRDPSSLIMDLNLRPVPSTLSYILNKSKR